MGRRSVLPTFIVPTGLFCDFALGLDVEIDWFHEEILGCLYREVFMATCISFPCCVITLKLQDLHDSIVVAWSLFPFLLSF